MVVVSPSCFTQEVLKLDNVVVCISCLLPQILDCSVCPFGSMILRIGIPEVQGQAGPKLLIINVVCWGHLVCWVAQDGYSELLSFPSGPLLHLWSLHVCEKEVRPLKWVAHDIIAMIGISEVIESLEEEFNFASFSGEDHWHAAFQGAVGSCLGCCSWLRGCSGSRCRSWCTTTTTSSTTSSTSTSTASMSGWLRLWLLRGLLLWGLLGLSASTSLCDRCCHHCHLWGCY